MLLKRCSYQRVCVCDIWWPKDCVRTGSDHLKPVPSAMWCLESWSYCHYFKTFPVISVMKGITHFKPSSTVSPVGGIEETCLKLLFLQSTSFCPECCCLSISNGWHWGTSAEPSETTEHLLKLGKTDEPLPTESSHSCSPNVHQTQLGLTG